MTKQQTKSKAVRLKRSGGSGKGWIKRVRKALADQKGKA